MAHLDTCDITCDSCPEPMTETLAFYPIPLDPFAFGSRFTRSYIPATSTRTGANTGSMCEYYLIT